MNKNAVRLSIEIVAPEKEEVLKITGKDFVFGRSFDSNVCVNDPAFSRSHFGITLRDNLLWAFDMGSSNGTHVNGKEIGPKESIVIKENDVITVPQSEREIKIVKMDFISLVPELPPEEQEEEDEEGPRSGEEDFDFSLLDEQILEVANQQVEQILQNANNRAAEMIREAQGKIKIQNLEALKKSERIIAEKLKNAEAQLEHYLKENKLLIGKELELKKISELKKIEEELREERADMLADLGKEINKVEAANRERRELLEREIKEREAFLAAKQKELQLMEQNLEQAYIDAEKELDERLAEKRNELEHLEAIFKAERVKKEELHAEKTQQMQKELEHLEEEFKIQEDKQAKILLDQIESQKLLIAKLNEEFEEERARQTKELEDKIEAQKLKIAKLDANFEDQRAKHAQLLEAQLENKKYEVEQEIMECEAQLKKAQSDFSSLFEKYEAKKNEQTLAVENLSTMKEQLLQEIAQLEQAYDIQKRKTEESAQHCARSLREYEEEAALVAEKKVQLEASLDQLSGEVESAQKSFVELKEQAAAAEEDCKWRREEAAILEVKVRELVQERETLVPAIAQLTQELSAINEKIVLANQNALKAKNDHAKEVEALEGSFIEQKLSIEKEIKKMREAEKKRLEELTHREIQQINKIKEDSLKMVLDLENSITQEISMATSKVFATSSLGVEKFREIAPEFEKSVRASLKVGVLSLLKNELGAEVNARPNVLTKYKKLKPFGLGVALSSIIFGLAPSVYRHIQEQTDPVRQQKEAELRAAARVIIKKFTPPKVAELGPTFVKSVIYTDKFYEICKQEEFRTNLMKKGSVYLYKQWNINEEKSIESFAMIFSLIDLLHTKAEKIDPDFEKRDIDKMEAIEKETLKKLEEVLGNEVRVEAALKFQARFYTEYKEEKGL